MDTPPDGAPTPEPPADELVAVGEIVKPHGVRGEVVVIPWTDVPEQLSPGGTVRIGDVEHTITRSRPHQGRLLLALDGIADRTEAEALRGRTVRAGPVDEDDFDTYFVHELVGLPLQTEDGESIGTVSALRELPAAAGYELLEIERADGSTVLVPGVDELVEVVTDQEGLRLVLVDPPEGLID